MSGIDVRWQAREIDENVGSSGGWLGAEVGY